MSVLDRFPHSTAELRRVKAVQFGILSPDEIVRAPAAAHLLPASSSSNGRSRANLNGRQRGSTTSCLVDIFFFFSASSHP